MISDTTVIILLYNTPVRLLNNLKVFEKFNLIILDQSNDKVFKKKLSKILPNIKSYTLRNKNFGFAKGINELVKKVKTKYFFCIQPDVKIDKKSILNLRKTIIKNKKAILVVPKIKKLSNFDKKNTRKKEVIVKKMIGAIFFADKKKFLDLGMFDEDFFFYWEDIELSNRIKKSQYEIFLNKEAKAIHNNSNSSISSFKTNFIRILNFMYGEFLYDYKVQKLRKLKILRKLTQNFVFLFFNILTLRSKSILSNLANIFVILKFIKYYLKKLI